MTLKFLLKPLNFSCQPDLLLLPTLLGIVWVEQLRVNLVLYPPTHRGHRGLVERWEREPCARCSSGKTLQPGWILLLHFPGVGFPLKLCPNSWLRFSIVLVHVLMG